MPIDITKKPFIPNKTFAQRLKPELRQELGSAIRQAHIAVAQNQGMDTSEEDKIPWGEDLDIGVRINCINIGSQVFELVAEWLENTYPGGDILTPLLEE